ncbi:hypothetical protein M9H77_26586 [Catharanthus roseus]|uniref:Uncharacterized protein n=1 Tax=Catharanthus roseus TaxID=4058 RepID=A0ACC0AA38_CATRO|nr:hypothetical protein M9H77_26586 [Catharanthus roseus]
MNKLGILRAIHPVEGGSTMKFHIGDRVEIEGHDEGLQGSYCSGTLIDILRGNGDYRIKYDNLHKNENSNSCYNLPDLVDIYENDGWWSGTISGKNGCKYYVYFLRHEVEKAYKLHDFRVHHDKVYTGRIKNTEKLNASSDAGASSSKPRPKHR